MPLQPGDEAPDFEPADEDARVRSLSGELLGGPVVVFFYPKAMTPCCTKESCHFLDLASEYAAVGARRIGISSETNMERHADEALQVLSSRCGR